MRGIIRKVPSFKENMSTHSEFIKLLTEKFLNHSNTNLLFCEGIKDGFYGTIPEISNKFESQCFELPCSENASVGMVLGAASYGLNPIICFQRVEFALLALEQLVNNSSKISYLTSYKRTNPLLLRLVIGRGWGQGPSHSQSLETIFAQIPDINVVLPVFPEDSKLIFETFSKMKSPTICLEHRWIHFNKNSEIKPKVLEPYVIKSGIDLTIVSCGYDVVQSLIISRIFEKYHISIEVINFFCLTPINYKNIYKSIQKTKKLITIDINNVFYGASSELIAQIYCSGILLDIPPVRLGAKTNFSPSSRHLSDNYFINLMDITLAVFKVIEVKPIIKERILNEIKIFNEKLPNDVPNKGFSGPF